MTYSKSSILIRAILLFIVLTINLRVTAQGNWEFLSPKPTIHNLSGTYFINQEQGWTVGTKGTILHTVNGGETWNLQYENNEISFRSVFFISENQGWVVSQDYAFHTDNGGATWIQENLPGPFYIGPSSIYFVNPDTGWIVGSYKTIFKTTDGGINWNLISININEESWLYDIDFTDESHGIAVGGDFLNNQYSTIMVTENGGDSWTEVILDGMEHLESVHCISYDNIWACGRGDDVIQSVDGGYTWETKMTTYGNNKDIYFFNQESGIVLENSEVFITQDGGETWNPGSSNPSSANSFSFVDSIGYTVGFHGYIYKSVDCGKNWGKISSSQPFGELQNPCFIDSLQGWASNFNSPLLFHTLDGGGNWEAVDIVATENIVGLSFPSPGFGYALGENSKLYKTENAGQTWEENTIGTNGNFTSFGFANATTGFIGGWYGLLLKTDDGGITWNSISPINSGKFLDIRFFSDDKIWVLNTNGSIYYTDNGGNTWLERNVTNTDQLSGFYFFDEQNGLVISNQGVQYKTNNGGVSWQISTIYSTYNYPVKIDFFDENEGWLIRGAILYYTIDKGETWNQYLSILFLGDITFLNSTTGWLTGGYSLVMKFHKTITKIETIDDSRFEIFPNPASDFLTLTLPFDADDGFLLNIYDISGKRMKNLKLIEGSKNIGLNISSFPSGVYFIELKTVKSQHVVKFVKE